MHGLCELSNNDFLLKYMFYDKVMVCVALGIFRITIICDVQWVMFGIKCYLFIVYILFVDRFIRLCDDYEN